jgi:hypothetical protein
MASRIDIDHGGARRARLVCGLVAVLASACSSGGTGALPDAANVDDAPAADVPAAPVDATEPVEDASEDASLPNDAPTTAVDARTETEPVEDTDPPEAAPSDAIPDVIADVTADVLADVARDADPPVDTRPVGCKLVVNEVQVGDPNPADEFVEIYNPCTVPVSLAGFSLVYRSARNVDPPLAGDATILATFDGTTTLSARGFLVVASGTGRFASMAAKTYGGGGLAATGGAVALRRPDRQIEDALFWGALPETGVPAFLEGTPAPIPSGGSSLARVPDGRDRDDNGRDFLLRLSTPGTANQ